MLRRCRSAVPRCGRGGVCARPIEARTRSEMHRTRPRQRQRGADELTHPLRLADSHGRSAPPTASCSSAGTIACAARPRNACSASAPTSTSDRRARPPTRSRASTPQMLEWADLIFIMDDQQRALAAPPLRRASGARAPHLPGHSRRVHLHAARTGGPARRRRTTPHLPTAAPMRHGACLTSRGPPQARIRKRTRV